MLAQDIVVATKRLQSFGLRSTIYAYFFLVASTAAIILSTVLNGVNSLSTILSGACMLIIPTAIYFSAGVVAKITRRILDCQVASTEEFDTSFKGPFSGISWVIFTITFFLACAEILFTYYINQSFGVYAIFLVGFTLVWMARFYSYFHGLKIAVRSLQSYTSVLNPKRYDPKQQVIIEEVQRGNTETLVDKRDDIPSP